MAEQEDRDYCWREIPGHSTGKGSQGRAQWTLWVEDRWMWECGEAKEKQLEFTGQSTGKRDFPGGAVLRIWLPVQEIWVRSLAQEDSTCCGATKPTCHTFCSPALEPTTHNYWDHRLQLPKPLLPRGRALQQERPPQWEACVLQPRVVPVAATREKPACRSKDPLQKERKK